MEGSGQGLQCLNTPESDGASADRKPPAIITVGGGGRLYMASRDLGQRAEELETFQNLFPFYSPACTHGFFVRL